MSLVSTTYKINTVLGLLSLADISSLVTATDSVPASPPSASVMFKHELFNDSNAFLLQKRGLMQRSESLNTQLQIECAERLGVSLSECNSHGVYINRTDQVKNVILNQISTHKVWRDVVKRELAQISFLDLQNQNLLSLSSHDFDGLGGLLFLYLANNRLSELPLGIFDGLQLLTLTLENNNLTLLPEKFLKDSVNLQWLSLFNNRLVRLPNDMGHSLSFLSTLYLDSNCIQRFPVNFLENATSLTELYVYNNPLQMTKDFFDKLVTLHADLVLYYGYKLYENEVSFLLNRTSVLVSDVSFFFDTGMRVNYSLIYPNRLVVPSQDVVLTQDQNDFLCRYLSTELVQNGREDALKWLSRCGFVEISFFNLTNATEINDEQSNGHHWNLKLALLGGGLGLFFLIFISTTYCLKKNKESLRSRSLELRELLLKDTSKKSIENYESI